MHARLVIFCISLLLLNPVLAQKTWNGSTSINWHDPSNWTPLGEPEPFENVTIGPAPHQPVIFDPQPAFAQSVVIQSSAVLAVEEGAFLFIDGHSSILDGLSVSGTLDNFGMITIVNTTDDGIACFGLVTNQYGALIIIDNTSYGIYTSNGTFSNFGHVSIGRTSGLVNHAVYNSGIFINESCAILHMVSDNIVSDFSAGFINEGFIVEEATGNSGIEENNGNIYNLNGGTFTYNIGSGSSYTTLSTQVFWTAALDFNWNNCGNWDQGFPPLANQDVIIPMTGAFDPSVTKNGIARSISVSTGAAFFVNESGRLHINGAGAPALTDGIDVAVGAELYINPGSKVEIVNAQDDGLQNSGLTICYGKLSMDNTDYGIYLFNDGILTNAAGGNIRITNTNNQGILNNAGTVTNEACAIIFSNGIIEANDTIINNGILVDNVQNNCASPDNGNITINNGVVMDFMRVSSPPSCYLFFIETDNGDLYFNEGNADDYNMNIWTGCSGGLNGWSIESNWHTGKPPSPGQDIFIFAVNTALYAYPILNTESPIIRSLHIGKGNFVNHPTLTLTSGSSLLIDGNNGLFEMPGIRMEEDAVLIVPPGAELLIDNTRSYGMDVYGGTVINSGLININNTDSSGIFLVSGIINNESTGEMNISNCDESGIALNLDIWVIDEATYFTNEGKITIDISKEGLEIQDVWCYFTNTDEGLLLIDSTSAEGIFNKGFIVNEDCSTLITNGRIQNNRDFNNFGLLIENSNGVSSIDTNNGVVMDFQYVIGNFAIGLNNGTHHIEFLEKDSFDLCVWTGCSGGQVNWTEGSNWHTGKQPQAGQDVYVFALNTSLYGYPVLNSLSENVRSCYLGEGIPINQPTLTISQDGYLIIDGTGAPSLTAGIQIFTDARLIVNEGGFVSIYHAQNDGLLVRQGAVMNAGTIETTYSGKHGINVYDGLFNNTATGKILISDCVYSGFYVDLSGLTTNAGVIVVNNAKRGVENGGEMINDTFGNIFVNATEMESILNWSFFTNQTCANITVQGNIFDHTVFNNNGLIIENSTDTSNVNINDGIIMNFSDGIFEVDTNHWILDHFNHSLLDYDPIVWTGCADTTDWKYNKNWHTDTMPLTGQDAFIYPVSHTSINDPILNDTSHTLRSVYIGDWVSGVQGVTFIVRDSAMLSVDGAGAPTFTDGIYAGEASSIFVNVDGKIRISNAQDDGISNSGLIDNQSIIEIENTSYGYYQYGVYGGLDNYGLMTIKNPMYHGLLINDAFANNLGTVITDGNIGGSLLFFNYGVLIENADNDITIPRSEIYRNYGLIMDFDPGFAAWEDNFTITDYNHLYIGLSGSYYDDSWAIWTGKSVTSDWEAGRNWHAGIIPRTGDHVLINASYINHIIQHPKLLTSSPFLQSVSINSPYFNPNWITTKHGGPSNTLPISLTIGNGGSLQIDKTSGYFTTYNFSTTDVVVKTGGSILIH